MLSRKWNRVGMTIALSLTIAMALGVAIWLGNSQQVDATSLYPLQKDRLGYGIATYFGGINDYPTGVASLNAGWYTDYWWSANPPRPNGIEYAQLVYVEGFGWWRYDTADGLANSTVNAIAIEATNHQWFGTNAGVSELADGTWTTYNTADGLANNKVRSIAIDNSGNLWFGTNAGVSKFTGSTWTTYNTGNGLAGNTVYAIGVGLTGDLWFGTNAGVSKFTGSTWTTYNTGNGLAGNTVYAIGVGLTGDLWFGTNAGVSKLTGSTWTTYNAGDGLASNKVQAILVDGTDKWFATNGGISVFDGSLWNSYTTADGLLHDDVRALAMDGAGNVWCGTMEGANKYDGTLWVSYPGYAKPTPNLASNYVYAVAVDAAQRKWFGTDSGGVSVFNEAGIWSQLGVAVAAQPGSLWILGNEPDGPQDVCIPTIYAQRYHEFYTFVKGLDPTAQVAVAGLVQATPLRMQWLDDMYHAYEDRYGVPIPVDVWNTHEQILREDYNNFGCKVPMHAITYRYVSAGSGAVYTITADFPLYCKDSLGNVEFCDYDENSDVAPTQTRVDNSTDYDGSPLYEKWDNANYDLFVEHIERYREWMWEHGQQDKPLIITEQGVLYTPNVLRGPFETEAQAHQRALDYMRSTFEYMLCTTSESRGYPADGYRLVQRWAWYSLNLPPIDYYGPLLEHDTGALTEFGDIFAEFTNNAEPQADSISQATNSVEPGVTHLITANYSDGDGYGDLDEVYLLVNTTESQQNAVYVRYVRATNRVYLRNVSDTAWLPAGGMAVGSGNSVSNANATLLAQQCSVLPTGNDLSVTWALSFKPAMAWETYDIMLKAIDSYCMFDGWNVAGDLFIGPEGFKPKSVSPNSGWGKPGETHHFTAVYEHSDGPGFIRYVEMLINDVADPTKCLMVRYDVVNDLFYLHHAASATAWMPATGRPAAAGGLIKHMYAILDVGQSSVIVDAHGVTVDWAVQFTWRMSGQAHNIFMDMEDTTGTRDGWHDYGDYVVNRTPNYLIPPGLTTYYNSAGVPEPLFPVKGTAYVGTKYWLDPAYRDTDREWTLDELYFLIADSLPADDAPDSAVPPGVYLKYVHNGGVENGELFIWGGSSWLGPYEPYDADSPVETTNATLTTRWSRPIHSDLNTIKVLWRIAFKSAFVGKHRLYMRAIDTMGPDNGGDTGWKWKGTVTVQ